MRVFLVFVVFCSSFLQAQNARELCQEWNSLKLKHLPYSRWDKNKIGAMWMQAKGVLTSELLVVSRSCQEVRSDCADSQALFMKGGHVCLPSGLERAEDFAYRKEGKNFYALVVPWGTPYEKKYEPGVLTSKGGLINPSHKIEDKVGPTYDYSFYTLWSPYDNLIERVIHKPYSCDYYGDHPCVRRAHQEITDFFRMLYKDFPREHVERFEEKIAAKNELREAEWKYRSIRGWADL